MAVPPFDSITGYLPAGIHEATWQEVESGLGFSRRRRELLSLLRLALDALASAGCRCVYLDGSFATSKAQPNDFDACWAIDGVDIDALLENEPLFLDEDDLEHGRVRQKARFGGERFAADWNADRHGTTVLEFFQRDIDDVPKGIIAIKL